jgi:hypothetical protein
VLHQLDGLLAGDTGLGRARVIPAEQEHQRGRQLLGPTPGSLGLEGVPVAIADRQLALKHHGLLQGALGPAAGWLGRRDCHWTFDHSRPHPDATAATL